MALTIVIMARIQRTGATANVQPAIGMVPSTGSGTGLAGLLTLNY